MTIKEFSILCNCNVQTIRYYDNIGLLCPYEKVETNGYRFYLPEQALDFLKIKKLQEMNFSIPEIKKLLKSNDKEILIAIDNKISETSQKLEKMRDFKKSYLNEHEKMKDVIEIIERELCGEITFDPKVEFGISFEEYTNRIKYFLEDLKKVSMNQKLSSSSNDFVSKKETKEMALISEVHDFIHPKDVYKNLKFDNGEYITKFVVNNSLFKINTFCLCAVNEMMKNNSDKNKKITIEKELSDDCKNHFYLYCLK